MTTQSEPALETELIQRRVSLGYGFMEITDEADLLHNLNWTLAVLANLSCH